MIITKPSIDQVPEFYRGYINSVTEADLFAALEHTMQDTLALFGSVAAGKENYAYAPGKWTLKEVLGHIVDAERVFAYRILRFSRRDATPLPGFDENEYVPNANTAVRSLKDICVEYEAVRKASIQLFRYMNDEMLDFTGMANNKPMTARQTGWIMAGHNRHHLHVVQQRYL